MEKGFSNSCGKSKDADAVLEKRQRMSSEEIQSCEAETSSEFERKYPMFDRVSTRHRTKGQGANYLKPQSPAVSTSRHLEVELGIYQKEICAERTSGSVSCSNGYVSSSLQDEHASDGNPKDSEASVQSMKRNDSAQNISVKSDVSSDTGSALTGGNNKSNVGRTKANWINANEDRLKSITHGSFHVTQLKTESSSSNSTHVIHPVSSSSHSFQETSVEAKSCKRCNSALNNCHCLGFKYTAEGLAVGSVALDLGMAAQISQRAIDNVKARDDKEYRMIADLNSTVADKIDIWKSNRSKQKISELLNQPNEVHSCERENTVGVAWGFARDAERRDNFYRVTPGSFSSIKEENGEAVRLSSVEFADPYAKCSMEDIRRVKLCNEKNNCNSFCSNEEVMDPETPMKNKHFLAAEGSSQGLDPALHETNSGPRGQESSALTTKPEEVVDQTVRLSGFDLNEDLHESEVEFPKHLVNRTMSSDNVSSVSTPVPVVAKSGVPIFLPIAPVKLEGELGWRGSAATSAFRPACQSNGSSRNMVSHINDSNCSSKHSQVFTGFDLNVAAAGDDSAMGVLPREHVAIPSAFPFKESSGEVGPKRADRLDIDLNRPSENDGSRPQSSVPVSLSRHSIVDLDLNANLSLVDTNDAQWPGQCSQLFRNKGLNNLAVSFQGTSRQRDFNWVRPATSGEFSPMQLFSHGHALPFLTAAQNVRPPMPREVHLQPMLPYTPQTLPPHAYPYNYGFYIGPTDQVSSTIHPSGMLPYITDPRGTTVIPQMSGTGAYPTFPVPPYLMQGTGGPIPNDMKNIRLGFNVNALDSSENGSRGGHGGQYLLPVRNLPTEEQMKSFRQIDSSATPMKRREPEGGWDSRAHGYRQVTSWH